MWRLLLPIAFFLLAVASTRVHVHASPQIQLTETAEPTRTPAHALLVPMVQQGGRFVPTATPTLLRSTPTPRMTPMASFTPSPTIDDEDALL